MVLRTFANELTKCVIYDVIQKNSMNFFYESVLALSQENVDS